jgi:hypothetical protein
MDPVFWTEILNKAVKPRRQEGIMYFFLGRNAEQSSETLLHFEGNQERAPCVIATIRT